MDAIQKLLTFNRMHHLKANVYQLYVLRCDGGRGMIKMEMNFKITTTWLHKYLWTTNDWMLQLVIQHDARKKAHSISQQINKFRQELTIQDEMNEQLPVTYREKKSKENLKMKKLNYKNKPGKTNLYTADILNWLTKLVLIKQTLINGYIV